MTRPEEAAALLRALWAPLDDDGLVELRPLAPNRPAPDSADGRRQRGARRWWPLDMALARLPAVLSWCGDAGLSAYFGVLPRTREGGCNEDTGPGAVAWVDLDGWKAGASAEDGLAHLRGLGPLAPSALVASGRGVHAYWLLTEEEPPEVCAGLSARLAALVGGDATSDPARLLRLPGSHNLKYAGRPLARLVALDETRRFHGPDLDGMLPPLPTGCDLAPFAGLDWRGVKVPKELPASVRAAWDASPRLRELWKWDPASGAPEPDAPPKDRSRSGYDWAVVACLVGMGIADPVELASAVRARFRETGRARDERQEMRVVESVLATLPKADLPALDAQGPRRRVPPAQIRILFDTDPAARLRVARSVGAPVRGDPPRATRARCPACGKLDVSWFIDPAGEVRRPTDAKCWGCGWRGPVGLVAQARDQADQGEIRQG